MSLLHDGWNLVMNTSRTVEKPRANPAHLMGTSESQELNEPNHGAEHDEHGHGVEWADLIRIAFVALAAVAVWFRLWEPFPRISVIGIAETRA